MLNECYVFAHFVFNLFLSSSVVKVRLLMKLYHSSLYSKKSHFVFTPLDKEVDFVLREGPRILRLVQVCYDMSSPKTEKREVDSMIESAGELKCDNLVIVTYNDKRTIKKDGYKIDVVPITEF